MSDTTGKLTHALEVIECKAGVCWGPGEPIVVEDVQVAPPKAGEVRIKVLYTGICHTDEYTRSGKDSEGAFPVILGHEGGGIVESVGEGVTHVKPGDHVIPLYTAVRATQGQGLMPDGTTRFKARGKDVFHFMGTSTFSQYTVVSEFSVVAINEKAPLEKACLLGCGITTAWGAVTKLPGIEGSNVAVFGCGCIGLGCINAARVSKANRIIAVDTNPKKELWAKKFGGDNVEFVNPKDLPAGKRLQDHLVEITDGGLDFTFDATGNVDVMRVALEASHKGWGVSTIIGVAPAGHEISTRPWVPAGWFLLVAYKPRPRLTASGQVTGRTWRGSAFGGVKGRTELPGIVEDYLAGKMLVDEYVTHHRTLKDIQDGFDDMHQGECIRCVVDMSKV
ncbi:hypothetical protein FRC10_000651 [Ceratobasidium sp. 414]|nr:hypothetical protein FRC10_000651 [Ceratobasidium sp. 414]